MPVHKLAGKMTPSIVFSLSHLKCSKNILVEIYLQITFSDIANWLRTFWLTKYFAPFYLLSATKMLILQQRIWKYVVFQVMFLPKKAFSQSVRNLTECPIV